MVFPKLTARNKISSRSHVPELARRLLGMAFVLMSVVFLLAHPQTAEAKPERVPFTITSATGGQAEISFDRSFSAFSVTREAETWSLPPDVVPQALLPLDSGYLLLARQSLAGQWRVFQLSDHGSIREFSVDPELGRRLLLMHAFVAGDEYFAVVYDVEGTIASGRSGSVTRDGMDLYRIQIDRDQLALTQVIDKSALGGLDNAFRDIAIDGGHLVCGQSGCWKLRLVNGVMAAEEGLIAPKAWAGFIQLDVFIRGNEPRALLRRDDDDRFTPPPAIDAVIYRDCPILREGDCIDLPRGKVPVNIDANGAVQFISSCTDIAAVLQRDLARLPNSGLTFVGMNNYEGRIPWGQVYVLDGLADVVERLALNGKAFDSLRQAALVRLEMDIAFWAELAKGAAPGFLSRRYSLERADILSSLHQARAARVMARIQALAPDARMASALNRIGADLLDLKATIESVDPTGMAVKKGVRFWFDGGNAPWNFQSGWIEGLVALHRSGIDVSSRKADARAMIHSFIATEIGVRRPNLWQYCAGRCQEGWTAADNVSVNTPNWEGNKTRTSSAHVSYRSMDARAILDAKATWQMSEYDWFGGYVRDLVEQGWLYPMVGAPLSQFSERPKLHAGLVGRYGRASIPFDIHNQIWAFDQMARDMGCITTP
jgi:hypothetical protein